MTILLKLKFNYIWSEDQIVEFADSLLLENSSCLSIDYGHRDAIVDLICFLEDRGTDSKWKVFNYWADYIGLP